MEHSIFGKLPPELRIMIYELALTNSKPIALDFKRSAPRPNNNLLAPTATCKLIHAESLSLFWRKNKFVVRHAGVKQILKIGRDNARCIRNVTYKKSLIMDLANAVEQSAEHHSFAVRLAPLVRFFRKTGACATLRLKVSLRGIIIRFSLPLEDLQVARREVLETCTQYCETLNQSARDGKMDNRACLLLILRSFTIMGEVVSIIHQFEVEIDKRESERRGRKGKKERGPVAKRALGNGSRDWVDRAMLYGA